MSYIPAAVGILIAIIALRVLVPVSVRFATQVEVRDSRPFARAFDARVVEFMRANYSGDPAQLEGALRGLLALAREMARQQPEPLGDDVLQSLVVTAVASHRIAKRGQVRSALDAVLRAERRAA
ncbi:MAG TPA: hypothetical protein VGK89_13720 [Candidatus Eisenbacteria bacterium]|jgi:hypothetical protein